jgi:hypothetical protein
VSPVELVINYTKLIDSYSTVGSLLFFDNWCPSVVIKGHEGGSKLGDKYALSINTIHHGILLNSNIDIAIVLVCAGTLPSCVLFY